MCGGPLFLAARAVLGPPHRSCIPSPSTPPFGGSLRDRLPLRCIPHGETPEHSARWHCAHRCATHTCIVNAHGSTAPNGPASCPRARSLTGSLPCIGAFLGQHCRGEPPLSFGARLQFRYIFGAAVLGECAVTRSFKDGCFQAHLLPVSGPPPPS